MPFDKTDITPTELQSALANCRQYWLNYGYERNEDEGVTLYRSGVPHPQLNGVIRVAGDDISRKVDYARQVLKDLPSVWWLGPDSHREAIPTVTAMGGLIRGKVPVMVARPSDLASAPLPAGISIEVIEDDRELLTWVECFAPSMGVSEGSLAQLQRVEMERPDKQGEYTRFAAKLNGMIVGTSALFASHGVAGIYVCTTDVAYRCNGIGAALTHHAALEGWKKGLKLASLQASKMGEPVYRRLGFRTVAEYDLVMF
ncbi:MULTISPECIES: GNAT family N-acetyltransferase [unclassified Agrobacterium]